MRKRILSLLCVLALCLGLLPVTALAAGEDKPGTLWVGQTQITTSGYWKTNSDGTLTTKGAGNDNYNVYYDGNGTLTLNNATIQGGDNVSEQDPQDYGIYASSTTGQSVSLTINLIGTNTVKGVGGIYITSDGNASLVIQSDSDASKGSLEVSGSGTTGIYIVVSGNSSGNPSLTINNASVEASTEEARYYGVSIVSYTTSSPTLSLTVNGGSLTAQDGIRYVSVAGTNSSNSLTVSDSALIKAIPNISASGASKPTPQGNGIVFDGNSGTVYGNVTLDESLTIEQDETLTIPQGSTLNTNNNLTNNGTIVNKGTLTGEVGGSGTVTPKITTTSLPNGTVDTAYNETLQADNTPTQWSVTSGSLPAGLSLGADGTISGTPTTAGTSTFTVKAANGAGSDSKEFSLTIQSATVPVTGVSLSKTALSLFTGESANLTATVEPGNATNKAVTWESSNTEVATVDNSGKVTAVGAGEATITVTTEDGDHTASCKVTVLQSIYKISADTTALDFGSVYVGGTQPAAQTVTITNTGNQSLTLTQPASTSGFEVGTLSKTALAVGETATFTVQPKTGLSVGTYSEDITVSSSQSATVTISATFIVKQRSSGGGSSSSSSVSDQTVDKIEAAKDGSTVEITLRTGQTTLDKEVFEELSGKDVTLVIKLPSGVTWTVNGQDIPENAKLSDLDLGVTLDASTIPASVINAITGAVDTIQLSLKHDGAFGFTMTLTAPLGTENKGLWANLYYYNEDSRELEFQAADKIASDGTAEFPFDHASQYAIVIDTDSHEPVELPFTDVPEDAWYEDAAGYVYKHGLMAGTSATTFAPEVTTSRAMIATILWRMAGSPVVNYAMTYTDVAQGQWYSEAVRWATSEGVVTGYGNGLFGTNDPITREQFAAMLWRYAQTEDYDVSVGEDTNILSYTDVADLSEYAIPAMQWACGAGVINGTGDGSTLTPQGQATRAQAATVLMRFCEQSIQ